VRRFTPNALILKAVGIPLLACFCLAMLPGPSAAQEAPPAMAADATPVFEVATIKPSKPEESRSVAVSGTQLRTTATSLVDLMMFAYSVHSLQIVDGPPWMRSEKYDLVMQPEGSGRPSTVQMRAMLQQLLADRFQLTTHHASKELEVYAIVAAKHGPHLTPASAAGIAVNTATIGFDDGAMTFRDATVAEFASLLQRYVQLEWPVVDHTHIAGKYDFKLSWTPDSSQFGGHSSFPFKADAPDLYAAMDEQLGLDLKPVKEPTDVLVIDRASRPSDN
jgi:uncharacterized protein (TIGR03435 family)